MKTGIYLDLFSNKEDIIDNFNAPKDALDNCEVILAHYEYEDYSGSASVYYVDNTTGLFYEVQGGHCSCYGLEDQWYPDLIGGYETFVEYSKTQYIQDTWNSKGKTVHSFLF